VASTLLPPPRGEPGCGQLPTSVPPPSFFAPPFPSAKRLSKELGLASCVKLGILRNCIQKQPEQPTLMKVAIFLPNWLGDAVMATPTLRALREHFGPQGRLIGILRPNLADLLSGTDWLDEQWYFQPGAGQREFRSWSLLGRMRREKFDLAVLMPNSLRPALIAWLAGVKQRIGYVRNGRGPLLTGRLCFPDGNCRRLAMPMVEYYQRLAELAGCRPQSPRLELATIKAEECAADAVWQRLGLRGDGRVVLLNPGGAYGPAKLWPLEYFGELARRVAGRLDHDVLVVCGPTERELARDVVRRAGHPRVFSLAEQPINLGMSKACIRRGRVMVSNDSGPRHVAAAFHKPVITLFGPFLPIWCENPTVRGVHLVRDDLDCIGCRKRTCPLGHHRCMRQITVDMVYRAIVQVLDREKAAQAA